MNSVTHLVSTKTQKKNANSKSLNFEKSRAKKIVVKAEILKRVKEFLEKVENSIMAPGVKDTITKNKVAKRKRFLLDTMDNLYKKFKKQESIKISRGSFYNSKPFWIVNHEVTDRDTCLCKDHSNMNFMIKRLHSLHLLYGNSSLSFVNSLVCDVENKD